MVDGFGARSSFEEKNLRKTEPYASQRRRAGLHSSFPRPAQANTSQPNAKPPMVGWGMSTAEYWQGQFEDYLKRRRPTEGI